MCRFAKILDDHGKKVENVRPHKVAAFDDFNVVIEYIS